MAATGKRYRPSRTLAAQAIELGFAVPQVVAHRMLRLALAGFPASSRDRREFHRMGSEKVAASVESWNAMVLEMLRMSAQFSLSLAPHFWLRGPVAARSASRHVEQAAERILGKGIAPVRRRAVANARRLARRR